MARKYEKLVIPGPWQPTGIKHDSLTGKVTMPPMMMLDKHIYPEATQHIEAFIVYGAGTGFGCGTKMEGGLGDMEILDAPMWHDTEEIFVFVGTDPNNTKDLGGEVWYWIGEGKEAEKYVFTTPTCIVIPPKTVHTPMWFEKVHRPFILIVIQTAPEWRGGFSKVFPADFTFPLGRDPQTM